MSEAVADHLGKRDQLDFDEALEHIFHLLVARPEEGANLVHTFFANVAAAAYTDRLMTYVTELRDTHRLSEQLVERSIVWSVWAAGIACDYKRAAHLAERGLGRVPQDSDIAHELTLQLAHASWRQGDRSRAADLARALAARRPETIWEVRALLLLGDLAELVDEALANYGRALSRFAGEPASPLRERFELDPTRWSVSEVETDYDATAEPLADEAVLGDADTSPANEMYVCYTDRDEIALISPDPMITAAWIGIGNAEGRAARIGAAIQWLDLARALCSVLDDTDGFQRVHGTQQRLLARHGDIGHIFELMQVQEQILVWAQATGSRPLEVQTLLDLASASHSQGRLDEARARYQQAAEVAEELEDPFSRAIAAEGLARIAVADGGFDEADRQLDTAAALYESVSVEDARRLDFAVGDRWVAARQPDKAKQAFERVLEWASSGDHADEEAIARTALAQVARSGFNLIEAEQQLRKAAALRGRLDPIRELETLAELATVLRLEEQDQEAEAVEASIESRATELSLESVLAQHLYYRAETAARRGDLKAARIGYDRSLTRFEGLQDEQGAFNSLLGLSWASSEGGDSATAIATARRAADIATAAGRRDWEYPALQAMGTALVDGGSVEEAIDVLKRAHQLQPDDPLASTNIGWAYLRADRFAESIEWSRRALELEPADEFPYRNIGHALLGLGRLDEAKAAYARAIAGRFGDDTFRNTLAELDLLARRHPGLSGLDEVVAWFQREQERLDTAAPRDYSGQS